MFPHGLQSQLQFPMLMYWLSGRGIRTEKAGQNTGKDSREKCPAWEHSNIRDLLGWQGQSLSLQV